LATRAVYSFTGFPGVPERHLYLHHDGYPTGAAWRFAMALRQRPEPEAFAAAFLASQPGAEPLAAPAQAADAEYRYRVQLLGGDTAPLQVQAWRRLPGGTTWQLRCGPMALELFIRRFMPGDPL
jgi:hypothetical protein